MRAKLLDSLDCSDPLSLQAFAEGACRKLVKNVKSIAILSDVRMDVGSCSSPAEVSKAMSEGRWSDLPQQLCFNPEVNSKVDFFYQARGNGNVDVMKVVYLPHPATYEVAQAMCSGDGRVLVFRRGP